MAISDLLRGAPPFVFKRYSSLGPFIRATIENEMEGVDIRAIAQEQMDTIQLLAFIYVLHDFLKDSHAAIAETVKTFEKLGVSSFRIGSTTFSENSPSVRLSLELGDDLLRSVKDEKIKKIITTSPSLGQLVISITNIVVHA